VEKSGLTLPTPWSMTLRVATRALSLDSFMRNLAKKLFKSKRKIVAAMKVITASVKKNSLCSYNTFRIYEAR
jgi:hypothetical protein